MIFPPAPEPRSHRDLHPHRRPMFASLHPRSAGATFGTKTLRDQLPPAISHLMYVCPRWVGVSIVETPSSVPRPARAAGWIQGCFPGPRQYGPPVRDTPGNKMNDSGTTTDKGSFLVARRLAGQPATTHTHGTERSQPVRTAGCGCGCQRSPTWKNVEHLTSLARCTRC